ncbi:translation initiation factor IF-2 [Cladophialophora psammophila CBS 110553]|uniref:Translation initiation factor IF-2, mitochondrial n=1 Tax=Cladophialophora psammophila CBS 110553 TaxID=1182543 RepID=W9X9W3_9EURO|nr:translation initiation factor IF-2 [Cladophialophora psammophila CBS 110553]EXJ67229.1 translation initiation factor IF-2 [Cladophialophora psammophila CBS 110553]
MVYADPSPFFPPSPPHPSISSSHGSPKAGHSGSSSEGSVSEILSRVQSGPRERSRDEPPLNSRSRLGQSQRKEQWSPMSRGRRDYNNNNVAGERSSRNNVSPRETPTGSQRPLFRYSNLRKPPAESGLGNVDNGNGVQREPGVYSPLSRIGTALKYRGTENPTAGEPRRSGASAAGIGSPAERGSRETQALKPMRRDFPRRTPQGSGAGKDPGVRVSRDNPSIWRPGSAGTPQRAFDPRTSRDRRVKRVPEGSEEPAIPDQEPATLVETELSEDAEDERRKRKLVGIKDPDRRARLYEIEDEESVQVSRKVKLPTARRSGISRAGSLDFHFDPDLAEEFSDEGKARRKKKGKQAKARQQTTARPEIILPEFISVEKLAQGLKVRLPDFIDKLEEEGFEGARYDHVLDSSTSAMFAEIYGFEAIIKTIDDTGDIFPRPPAEDSSVLPPRPPIVTIMGHVDHGKTTILDYFRKANVVATEHGGITQHIGAFSVTMPGSERNITFLDTPGHAAFLEMRRRGAVVTDIVVLVVAADDSVKAQTIEAIKHAREAGVQIIVAINKVDKPEADIEQVKRDLMQHEIVVEDFGGEYQAIPVSGKTGQGMGDLEEAILTLADVADFRAETDGPAEGWIIESKVGATGRVATILVRRGTLRPGDFIVAGTTWARIRTLRNDSGALIDAAPPGTPVQIDGWRGEDPEAGLEVLQAENEQRAKEAVGVRKEREEAAWEMDNMTAINATRAEEAVARTKVLEWEKEQGYLSMGYKRRPKDNEGWIEKESSGPQLVHFVVKADVAGSTEALVAAVGGIGNNEIRANIIHSGTGGLTESDIKMLAATGEVAYAISFNQPIDNDIRQLAAAARIQILDHNIIYKVTDDVTEKVSAELPPIVTQRVLGEAEVGDIFDIKIKKGTMKIAGCRVTNGTIRRSEKIRVLRKGEVIYTGMLNSFKNIKKDVTEMRKGSECGMGFENWEAFEVGDQIQSFEEISEKRALH